jgi:hypothetical protein
MAALRRDAKGEASEYMAAAWGIAEIGTYIGAAVHRLEWRQARE